MDKLIETIAKASLGAKVGAVAGVVALVTVLNYFVVSATFGPPISDLEQKIRDAAQQQKTLDAELGNKQGFANNLNQFRRQRELLEQQLNEARLELPEEAKIDELLQLFQDRAQKAGLEITLIEPKKEEAQGFYARIPVPMTVVGTFHEVATFIDSIGRLRRIVNVNELTLEQPKDVNGEVVLTAKFVTTAFKFLEPTQGQAAAPAGGRP
jgi:type IV pilus assembly protein PilO